jgi:poly(3-hydroxybutyrate) depolymerase
VYRVIVLLIVFGILAINAQTINLRGVVSNKAGKPINKAIVTLSGQGLKDTTGTDGKYLISNGTPVIMPLLVPQNEVIVLDKGFLEFSLPERSPVSVSVFDIKGKLLKKEVQNNASTGFYHFNIKELAPAAKVLIVKASIGRNEVSFRYLPLNNKRSVISAASDISTNDGGQLSKIAVVGDTLKTTATGYTAKRIAITSYNQELNITLDTIGGDGAKPSAGCGKPKTMADSVSTTINVTATGQTREYILVIPKDYDMNHPYALWFTMHGNAGTALGVARGSAGTNYGFFGMRKLANKDKGTTIFCAPNGIGTQWAQGDKDIQFFRAMIKKFESELCIDESRIFASGFSMGGSMSYALACALPDTFRAICMHSGGNMSGCNRPAGNPGKIAMFITHGTTDGTCTWPNWGPPQLADIAQRDGCTAMNIASMVNPTDDMHPQCVDYKNCESGLPCRACIFRGGHTPSPGPVKGNDWGEASTWVPDSTWSYFKQFYRD